MTAHSKICLPLVADAQTSDDCRQHLAVRPRCMRESDDSNFFKALME